MNLKIFAVRKRDCDVQKRTAGADHTGTVIQRKPSTAVRHRSDIGNRIIGASGHRCIGSSVHQGIGASGYLDIGLSDHRGQDRH